MKNYILFSIVLLKTVLLFSQSVNQKQWLAVKGPNYTTNEYLAYPHSNTDLSLTEAVVQLPQQPFSFIPLIDFYGEGRIEGDGFALGFKSAYNINLQYKLVSKGPDTGRRIPNRIPVASYDGELGLSKYVANDKVTTITLTESHLQQNTVQEMTRMIRKDGLGKIIIYGYSSTDTGIEILEKELAKIDFHYTPNYVLRSPYNETKGLPYEPRVYKSKKIKVTGKNVLTSLNPKTDLGITQANMVTLNYSSLLALNADLTGGIKGTIDKPGGKIEVVVYAYDYKQNDGIQKVYAMNQPVNDKIVYKAYSDVTSTDTYIEKTTKIPYGFARTFNGIYRTLGETDSNNVKLLGGNSRSGWKSADCESPILRGITWFKWKVQSLFYNNIPYSCKNVITQFRSGKHPVLIKVTIKDATLYDLKIPGVTNYNLINLIEDNSENPIEYKALKKIKITVLESPNEHKEANAYKEKIMPIIKDVNRYYTAKTGNIPNPEITAEIGNPRILFNNVELIIKKGSAEKYDINLEADVYKTEAEISNNDDEIIQIIYTNSLGVRGMPPSIVMRGYTSCIGDAIKNDHYSILPYRDIFKGYPSDASTDAHMLAHELGHYFGLFHPFQGECAQTNGGDMISDTPPAIGPSWYVGVKNPCENAPYQCNGMRRQIENLMDYGPCGWLFTEEQARRINTRINTKPSLFTRLMTYDTAVDPDDITITLIDKRHGELRRKRSLSDHDFVIEISSSDSNSDYRDLKIISNVSENVTIQIHNLNSTLVYENNVRVEEGQNNFKIAASLFKPNTLYIVSCTNEHTTEHIKFISRHY